ncbi:hypothetical protein AFM18_24700 [Achromobacter spanius]|uniref:Uncharacterized protein n=2 Tax=Achromobacter spanius TaxID=217203 RepID=A0AAW3HXW5_9BURK|nr:hypothetical protein AFM18_24700 [Achromobacter spanius]
MGASGITWGTTLDYSVELPRWTSEQSGYAMYLALKRHTPAQIVVAEQHNSKAIAKLSVTPKRPGHQIDGNATRQPTIASPLIAGSILIDLGEEEIESATLHVKYWPNVEDTSVYGEITAIAFR